MMSSKALSVATQALTAASNTGLPLTDPLVDKTALGSFWVRVGVAIGTADTPVAIQLPRKPSCYVVVRNSTPAVVYDGTTPGAWTGTVITLRASAATTVSLLVG